MEKLNFLYCEPDLKNYEGHLFNTAKFLSKELLNLKDININFCLDENCDEDISKELKGLKIFTNRPKLKNQYKKKYDFVKDFFLYNFYIFKGLRKIIKKNINKNIIYFNTTQHIHLLSIIFILIFYPKKIQGCILTFRLSFIVQNKKIKRYYLYYFLIKFLEIFKSKIIINTDTENILDQLNKFTKIKKKLMPIPHLTLCESKENDIYISFIGSSRKEKKTYETLRQIFHSKEIHNLRSKINFIIHGFGEEKNEIVELVNKFKNEFKINLRLKPLSFDEYYQDLKKSSISIFNYDNLHYQHQSSGTFAEAIFYNVIPVTSDNTWMTSIMIKSDLEFLIIKSDNDLNSIILETVNKYEQKRLLIKEKFLEFKKFHTNKNFINLFEKQIKELA